MNMNYVLCHKEISVLNMEIDSDGTIIKINEIYDEGHAPIGVFNSGYESPVSAMRRWWKNRSIPASRQNLNRFLDSLAISSPIELVSKSFGLSLSDHYWIKPAQAKDGDISWKSINFFENNFSEDIGALLSGIGKARDAGHVDFLSPENTSDGWLRKKWIIAGEKRILLKGGSYPFQQEPFNEVIASDICTRLGISHVEYTLKCHKEKMENNFLSCCPCFVTVDTELVPATRILSLARKSNDTSPLKNLLNCCKTVGINDLDLIKRDLGKMFALDFLIANTDRHFNNFGFLRNPNTLEWLGLAPLYDNGTSLFYNQGIADLTNSARHESKYVETKPLAKTLDKQLTRALRDTQIPSLDFSSLKGIGETFAQMLSENPQNGERSQELGKILNGRILETERMLDKLRMKNASIQR